MANFIDRLGLAIGGVPTQKGQQITPEQRQLSSTALMNAAQALLAASDKSGTSFGGAIGEGLAGAQEGVQNALKAQSELANNQLTQQGLRMELDAKTLAIGRAQDINKARQNAPRFSDYNDYNTWAMASADHYFDYDLPDEASKFVSIFKPQTKQELNKFVFDESAKWEDKSAKLTDAYANYDAVKRLIASGSGGQAYGAMIKVIKALDDSVVRDSERQAFNDSFGKLEGFRSQLDLAVKGEITDKVGAEILNIAAEALNIAQSSYNQLATSRRSVYEKYNGRDVAFDIVPEFTMRKMDYVTPEMFAVLRKEHSSQKKRIVYR